MITLTVAIISGCNFVKKESKTATLVKAEVATQEQLLAEISRFARVNSMRAKMNLKFEDNSFAEFGSKEVYRSADGEVVVQRPGNIRLTVRVPVIKTDVAQMTSDGTTFRVAILQDGGSGKYKKFVKGTNNADYSRLQSNLDSDVGSVSAIHENVNAFSSLRPQHFVDAMLVRPVNPDNTYTLSSIFQNEIDNSQSRKSPLYNVMRGYYLVDEYVKNAAGEMKIDRRFWFDRSGGIRLARQQIFDAKGEIESDILYGKEGKLTETADYNRLPLEIQVTRPKEKYSMKLTYQTPSAVEIGETYPEKAFSLLNSWGLDEVDLDQKLREVSAGGPVNLFPVKNASRFK